MTTSRVRFLDELVGVPHAQPRTLQRNAFLFQAESPVDAGYLIRSGHVRCFLLNADGRETTTAILGPGQFVGLAAVVGQETHQQFCEALTHVEAWSVPAAELRRCCENSPLVQGWLLGNMVRRVELALTLRRGISLLSAPDRADDIEVRSRALSGIDSRTVRQTILASLLQIRPETLARRRRSDRRTAGQQPPDQFVIGSGRREFAGQNAVVKGGLPDGCIGRITSGQVELSLTGSGSRSVVVETLGPGDLFGFTSLLGLPALPYTLTSITPGAIQIIPAEQFLRLLAGSPSASAEMVVRLANRVQMLDRQLARAVLPDVACRLARVLREVASDKDMTRTDGARYVPAGWSHVVLARHLGVCRETVTRGLAALVKAGIITRQGRRIVLVSEPASPQRERPAINGATTRKSEGSTVVWLSTATIDEPDVERNSRRKYTEHSIQELAASLRQEGFLQPLCVRRKGARFEVVFGVRRFRAAVLAGLTEVPCTVREADDNRALLLKALENLHREQLSNIDRVNTIGRLAASGLGVREISRRTGLNPSTISRWLRKHKSAELKQAFEQGRIDIGRAVVLADAPANDVRDLIENDRRQLADALRSLRTVRSNVDEPLLVQNLQVEICRISGGSPVASATASAH